MEVSRQGNERILLLDVARMRCKYSYLFEKEAPFLRKNNAADNTLVVVLWKMKIYTGYDIWHSRQKRTGTKPNNEGLEGSVHYDPNYSYGDDEEPDKEPSDDDEYKYDDDEFDEDDDDDNDDDDSWKVRRSAIHALTAVVESKKHNPSILWNKEYEVQREKSFTVPSALVARFKEREENCRVVASPSFFLSLLQLPLAVLCPSPLRPTWKVPRVS